MIVSMSTPISRCNWTYREFVIKTKTALRYYENMSLVSDDNSPSGFKLWIRQYAIKVPQ